MAVNQVKYGNQIIIDITDSTVNANTLLAGYKAYGANGEQVTGNVELSYHITLTQAQYDELTEEEKLADENFFYIEDMEVTSAEIDDTTTATDKVWSSNKINTEFGLKADKTQITNPNLLDNPWFTVNQRGASSYDVSTFSGGYSVDRWRVTNNTSAISVTDDGIVIDTTESNAYQYFQQRIENGRKQLGGKTVTLSILMKDGTIYTATGICPSEVPASSNTNFGSLINDVGHNFIATSLYLNTVDQLYVQIGCNKNARLEIKAVKLELGSISTLALDTAPNYATELLKCQRYFQRHSFASNNIMTLGAINPNQNVIWGMFYFTTPMRTVPSAILPSASDLKVYLATSWSVINPTGIQLNQMTNELGTLYISLASSYTAGTFAILQALNATQIDLSADL